MALGVFAQDVPSATHTPFGDVQLLSCTTALRTKAPIYLGLHITPMEDWHIQSIDIQPSTSNAAPIQIFTPFSQPLANEVIYPISSILTQKPDSPVTFNIQGTITACHGPTCVTEQIRLAQILTQDWTFVTPDCAVITAALSHTALPMHMNTIKGWAIPTQKGTTEITVDLPTPPQVIQLYDFGKNPLNLPIRLNKKRLQFTWPTQDSLIQFYIQAHDHIYEVELPLLSEKATIPTRWLDLILTTFYASLCFLLLSALPIFWARITNVSIESFQRQAKQIIALIVGCGIGALVSLVLWHNIPLSVLPAPKICLIILMIMGFIFIPAHPLLAILLTFLAPKPYLTSIQTFSEQLCFSIFWSISASLAFIVQIIWAKPIFTALHNPKQISFIWWVARIPWLLLLVYTCFYL